MQAICDFILRCADKDYPRRIHLPHALISLTQYRQWREAEKEPTKLLFDLVASYWCSSQGGGAAAIALLDGQFPLGYVARKDHMQFHFLAYLAVYWSPRDVLYRILARPSAPLRLWCVGCSALDCITALCGCVDRGVTLYPENKLMPMAVGLLVYNSGAFIRWLEARGRHREKGQPLEHFMAAPTSAVTRGLFYAFVYWLFGHVFQRGRQRNRLVLGLSLVETSIQVLEDALGLDAFAPLHAAALAGVVAARRVGRLGVGPAEEETKRS